MIQEEEEHDHAQEVVVEHEAGVEHLRLDLHQAQVVAKDIDQIEIDIIDRL